MAKIYEVDGVEYECTKLFVLEEDGNVQEADPSTISDDEMYDTIEELIAEDEVNAKALKAEVKLELEANID